MGVNVTYVYKEPKRLTPDHFLIQPMKLFLYVLLHLQLSC